MIVEYITDNLNSPTSLKLIESNGTVTLVTGILYRIIAEVLEGSIGDLTDSYRPVEFRYDIPISPDTFSIVMNLKRIIKFIIKATRVDYETNLFIPYRGKEQIYIRGGHNIDLSVYKPFTHTFMGEAGWYDEALKNFGAKITTERVNNYIITPSVSVTEGDIKFLDNTVEAYKRKFSLIPRKLLRRCRELNIPVIAKYPRIALISGGPEILRRLISSQ
jgi:hypothetical protein